MKAPKKNKQRKDNTELTNDDQTERDKRAKAFETKQRIRFGDESCGETEIEQVEMSKSKKSKFNSRL